MHILRIDYKTGLRIDFGFLERTAAREAVEAINTAKPGALVTIIDDHGHEGTLRADGVLAVVLTDLVAEVQGQIDVQGAIAGVRAINEPPPERERLPVFQGPMSVFDPSMPTGRAAGPKPPFSA